MMTFIKEDPRLATRELTNDLLDYIIQKIVAAVHPQRIILFGAWGRGNARPESDLDLFVVYDGAKTCVWCAEKLIYCFGVASLGWIFWSAGRRKLKCSLRAATLSIFTMLREMENWFMSENNRLNDVVRAWWGYLEPFRL
ncbi:MAG: nucleotidyltransferase domain-containing protein [Anaerolineales bacterium]|nr:nucleotidyltransferase domain-containing protein [Anaerolineales bacterium]MCX7754877.1 nucleotidyltransferase domain-containing protein [Anaerolineales bacterium]MDW8278695.1 nucleotidyltransferase domain-containing protein [Anaerolineales bacterium]